jgi:phosphopantetheinyl transferase (holo-ACP synthase)
VTGGIDLVDTERLALAIRRSGDGFAGRILAGTERELLGGDPGTTALQEFAGVFGAKECVVKLMHGLPAGATLHDITVPCAYRPGQDPIELTLHGAAREWATQQGIRVLLSTTRITDRVLLTWALATLTPAGDRP